MKIKLKEDLTMFAGYAGRGTYAKSKVFPKGTEAVYTKTETKAGTYHTATVMENGVKWQSNNKT